MCRAALGFERLTAGQQAIVNSKPDRRLRRVCPFNPMALPAGSAGSPLVSALWEWVRPRTEGPPIQSTSTHSDQAWSYQNPGGLACPVETMRSILTPSAVTSSVNSSSAAMRWTCSRCFRPQSSSPMIPPYTGGASFTCPIGAVEFTPLTFPSNLTGCAKKRGRSATSSVGWETSYRPRTP